MRFVFTFILTCTILVAGVAIEKGDTEAQVREKLGKPTQAAGAGNRKSLFYGKSKILLYKGKVISFDEIQLQAELTKLWQSPRSEHAPITKKSSKRRVKTHKKSLATHPSSKLLTQPDGGGDVWYAVKTPVVNKTATHLRITVELQAVDKDGFELESIRLSGLILPLKPGNLTDKSFMKAAQYKSIAKWQIKETSRDPVKNPAATVSGIMTRIQTQPDNSGDIWYAIKADIVNNGTGLLRRTELQAVDKDGYEVTSVTLSGNIAPGKKTTLSEKTFMPLSEFKRIAKWRYQD